MARLTRIILPAAAASLCLAAAGFARQEAPKAPQNNGAPANPAQDPQDGVDDMEKRAEEAMKEHQKKVQELEKGGPENKTDDGAKKDPKVEKGGSTAIEKETNRVVSGNTEDPGKEKTAEEKEAELRKKMEGAKEDKWEPIPVTVERPMQSVSEMLASSGWGDSSLYLPAGTQETTAKPDAPKKDEDKGFWDSLWEGIKSVAKKPWFPLLALALGIGALFVPGGGVLIAALWAGAALAGMLTILEHTDGMNGNGIGAAGAVTLGIFGALLPGGGLGLALLGGFGGFFMGKMLGTSITGKASSGGK
jgi:hypothetical protein